MPDITMCAGEGKDFTCPLKESCYRYKAKPFTQWQSYFVDLPYDKGTKSCDCYWRLENKDILKDIFNNK